MTINTSAKRPIDIGRISFLIMVLAALFCTGPAAAHARNKPPFTSSHGIGDTIITWHEGARVMQAHMALNEIAVLTSRRIAPDEERVRRLFHRGARAEKSDHLILLESPESFSRDDLVEKIRALGALENVAGVSPVFFHGTTRLIPTGRIICRFGDSASDDAIAALGNKYGLEKTEKAAGGNRHTIYRTSDPFYSIAAAEALAAEEGVEYACPDWLRLRTKKALPSDTLFPYQWHLRNIGQSGGKPGEDINVTMAWDSNVLGSASEVIAIVDDGLEISHEDLAPNVIPQYCYDFLDNDADPTGGEHGTSCAGIAAARGYNGIGVSGGAPLAGLAGLRIMDNAGYIADTDEAAALSYHSQNIDIYSNSWGPPDPVCIPEGPSIATETMMREAVESGRGELGSIYVWAGGNGYASGDNANYDGYTNARYVIAVAASTDGGTHAPYSEEGANILINAPSSNGSGTVTTDRSGSSGYNWSGYFLDYTNDFGGTSSATSLVAGVIALMLEVNPNLTWRDVRYILAETAEKNDPSDADWATNGAGYHVNHKYGFGRVDATGAVAAATRWNSIDREVTVEGTRTVGQAIPDNNTAGMTDVMMIEDDITVEHVEVDFSATDHTSWTDLEIILASPDGTQSVLAKQHMRPGGGCDQSLFHYSWRFGSIRHLGESSKGTWRLTVRDLAAGNTGTLQSWILRIFGTTTSAERTITANNNDGGGCFIQTVTTDKSMLTRRINLRY